MELLIDRLLTDFESGTLSRRRLVQALTMMVIGAPAVFAGGRSTEATPAPPMAPWKTVWLDHISYQVADYKKSVDFYTSLMGWRVTEDTGSEAVLNINGIGGIIIRNYPKGQEPPRTLGAGGAATLVVGTPVTGVVDHISWGVEPWNTEAVRRVLDNRHLSPEYDDDSTGFKSFHVKDPDGWDLQISNQTPEKHDLRADRVEGRGRTTG